MRRNLAAARSGAAGIGVLAAAGAGSAPLVAQLVLGSAACRAWVAGAALLCRGLAAALCKFCVRHLRRASGLGAAIRLLLRTGVARLTFRFPDALPRDSVLSAIGLLLERPPLHFVRTRRRRHCGWDAAPATVRCFWFTIRPTRNKCSWDTTNPRKTGSYPSRVGIPGVRFTRNKCGCPVLALPGRASSLTVEIHGGH